MSTLYDVLKVSNLASPEELKTAYRKLVRSSHPDLGGDVDVFRKVQEAWETLGYPNKRASYDSLLQRRKANASNSTGSRGATYQPTTKTYTSSPKQSEPIYTEEFLQDFFKYGFQGDFFKEEVFKASEEKIRVNEEASKAAREQVKTDEAHAQARRQRANTSTRDREGRATQYAKEQQEQDTRNREERYAAYAENEEKRKANSRKKANSHSGHPNSESANEYYARMRRAQEKEQAKWDKLGPAYAIFQFSNAGYATVKTWKKADIKFRNSFMGLWFGLGSILSFVQILFSFNGASSFGSFISIFAIISVAVFISKLMASKLIWKTRTEQFPI
jgi:curved DNA-binding protein CbpA